MDGFGTVRKKQSNSQTSKVLSLWLGSGIIVDLLSAFLELPSMKREREREHVVIVILNSL